MPKHSLAVAYSMKRKKKASGGSVDSGDMTMNLSKGGDVKGVHDEIGGKGISGPGHNVRRAKQGEDELRSHSYRSKVKEILHGSAKEQHKEKLDELRAMPSPKLPKAHGGEVSEGDPAWACSECGSHSLTFMGHQDSSHEMDMISSALHKRKMAHGGKTCAPGDVGGSPKYSKGGQVANDEGQAAAACELPNEFDDLVLRDDEEMDGYTGKNSGDDIGGPSKSDVVSKAMLKRKKK